MRFVVILPELDDPCSRRAALTQQTVPWHNTRRPAVHRTNHLQMHVCRPPPLYSLVEQEIAADRKHIWYVHITRHVHGQTAGTTAATPCVAFPFSAVAVRVANIHYIYIYTERNREWNAIIGLASLAAQQLA